jgi:hypothetical protein
LVSTAVIRVKRKCCLILFGSQMAKRMVGAAGFGFELDSTSIGAVLAKIRERSSRFAWPYGAGLGDEALCRVR